MRVRASFKRDNPFDQFDAGFAAGHGARNEFPNNVSLSARDVPDAVVRAQAATFFKQYLAPRDSEVGAARLAALEYLTPLIVGPSLVILAFACVIGWIMASLRTA
ncbi:hypothetical protein NLM27_28195 [Bradyrhizobium sp. CCGB12]|uniref:hypothetical protein n=1 Tax=Bradyrhizobium sp. CCGB12 TaxID=2949632 RepID=UPI0020B446C0|nr:hypothetical protein [Bradyrhizobium sp. CCGB12]MCP3392633.1 hypothetical protein [Bradyrhizobium sp. CCGB12]